MSVLGVWTPVYDLPAAFGSGFILGPTNSPGRPMTFASVVYIGNGPKFHDGVGFGSNHDGVSETLDRPEAAERLDRPDAADFASDLAWLRTEGGAAP